MTDDFFIRLISSLLRDPNVDSFVRGLHAEYHTVLGNRRAERALQLAEGRDVIPDETDADLDQLAAFCCRTLSRHTALEAFVFWYQQQGVAQRERHDQGRQSSWLLVTIVSLLTCRDSSWTAFPQDSLRRFNVFQCFQGGDVRCHASVR